MSSNSNTTNSRQSISLNGQWRFFADSDDQFKLTLPDKEQFQRQLTVPGSWEEQGIGEEPTYSHMDTWTKRREYVGAAWYALSFELPNAAGDQLCQLELAGVHWTSKLWINGQYAGEADSLLTEHHYDVTKWVRYGTNNEIMVCIDNRMKLPLEGSHIHTKETATNWGGITGGATITLLPALHIEKVAIYPNYSERQVMVKAQIAAPTDFKAAQRYELTAVGQHRDGKPASERVTCSLSVNEEVELIIPFEEGAIEWSDSNPYLYKIELSLLANGNVVDHNWRTVGLRQLHADGTTLTLNGDPIFLRGYVDCCIFPLTGYPSWDKTHYVKQFEIAKQYGFNHVRLHSWTPPRPFWEAADEAGMLVQTELPNWSTVYLNRGSMPNEAVHQYFRKELLLLLDRLQEHPSFVLFSMGNELISEDGHEALNELVRLAKQRDPSRLYTDNTGFGQLPVHDREGDFYVHSLNWHIPLNRDEVASPDTTVDCSGVARLATKPLLAHEHAQYTMYVRPSEKSKYTGALRPSWLDTIEETLEAKGLTDRVDEFISATGTHLVRTLKESMERVRRTADVAGIQLLDIRDFPGQGHATTGILDVFWDSKGIVEPEEFIRFNGETVLLMESPTRTYYAGEKLEANIKLSHYGNGDLTGGTLKWRLRSGETIIDENTIPVKAVKRGEVERITSIVTKLPVEGVHNLVLEVYFINAAGEKLTSNEWEFWSLPRLEWSDQVNKIWTSVPSMRSVMYGARMESNQRFNMLASLEREQTSLVIVDDLTTNALNYLVNGGSLWLMAKPGNQYDDVLTKYMPIFWNYLMFSTQTGTTMGMLVHDHPALGRFPHDGVSNWQWYHLVNRSLALSLDGMLEVQPIVEVIDNFNRAKRLAYAFEAQVGKGKLFVSSLHLADAEQLKRPENAFLLGEFVKYLTGTDFQPRSSITVGQLLSMFKMKSIHE